MEQQVPRIDKSKGGLYLRSITPKQGDRFTKTGKHFHVETLLGGPSSLVFEPNQAQILSTGRARHLELPADLARIGQVPLE